MTDQKQQIADLTQDLHDLTVHFYIAVAVLSCVLFLVILLTSILYYWLYVLEKEVKKPATQETGEYKIRRPVLREETKPPNRQLNGHPESRSSLDQNGDAKHYKNPLTNSSYQQPQSTPFKEHLQQQLQQNNPHQRYGNLNGFSDIKRNSRQTEQQLHQNFYGMDNSNFQY